MSTALAYQEPHFFAAGALALAVHLAFFTPLYFAAKWQAQQPEAFTVEMWDSLPDMEVTPVQEPTPPPPTTAEAAPPPKVVEPVSPPVQADIEVRDKNEKKKKQAKEKAAARAKQEKERRELDEYVAQRVQAEQARIRAEVDTATRVQIERYQDMIRNKIRHKIVKQDVPDTAAAVFSVTLLPDGSVLDVVLEKSSGYRAYDDAVERAIILAQPLPMPPDAGLQKMFREVRLTIRP